ncbi:MAG: DUF3881 family protein [Eubacteriales bacterium]|nr:DUF3881 family protein [Eubacteriales bacterium]
MHKYLKSIGFSEYNTTLLNRTLKNEVMQNPNRKEMFQAEEENYFCFEKDYGECFGLCVIKAGETEENSEIVAFYPYVRGYNYLYNEKFDIDPFSDGEGFYGYCDDSNIGIPMIFFINNPVDFRSTRKYLEGEENLNCVTLSGLASDGVVLLPIEQNESQKKKERRENEKRLDMINQAKSGSVEAMEALTIQDMSQYTCVNIRSKKEDIFSIVSSYFMPHTVECDKYAVLGDITDVVTMINKKTKEEVYYLSLKCNGIDFEVMINKKDMMGVPAKGLRWKGHLWMQGQMDCL